MTEAPLPDHLRCNRTDGRQWRCSRPVMENKKLCAIHHLQGRHRQNKQKVPESLKIQRKTPKYSSRGGVGAGVTSSSSSSLQGRKFRAKNAEKRPVGMMMMNKKKKKKNFELEVMKKNEALDEAVKKMNLKRGDMQLELIRMVLKREVEKEKNRVDFGGGGDDDDDEEDSEETEEVEEVQKELPNGFMAISSFSPSVNNNERNGSCSNDNVGAAAGPSCDVKIGGGEFAAVAQRRCFRSKNIEPVPIGATQVLPWKSVLNLRRGKRKRCHCCRKSRVRRLIKCSSCRKEFFCVNCIKERHFESLEEVRMACPICRGTCDCKACSVNQDSDFGCEDQPRDKNKIGKVLWFHYLICVLLPVLKQLNQEESVELEVEATFKENKPVDTSNKSYSCTYIDSSASFHSKTPNGSIGISQPTELGGCGDGVLDLRVVFPLKVTKEMEVSAEEIVGSYELPELVEISSCCSLCLVLDCHAHRVKHLQEAARREGSNDNFLYYPTVPDVHINNAEHFQKHWGKGHPVIVRNVLQDAADLNWDPVVMFCTYLKNSGSKSENDERVKGATDVLDWFEVDIGVRQLFLGSLMGQTHANICDEKLKLKCWLSSHLFQKLFPAHYDQIIHALPLPEYMDPKSGLLNIAAKLPQDMLKPDLGPSVSISYGSGGALTQADSEKKLFYAMSDVVNILAYATDVPVSSKELNIIRMLVQNSQEQRLPTEISPHPQKGLCGGQRKSSFKSEDMDVDQYDVDAEEQHQCRSDTQERPVSSLKDGNLSHNKERISDFDMDSEALELRCSAMEQLRISKHKTCSRDHSDNLCDTRKKKEDESCGAQWDVFRRQDVPKLIEYLRRHCNEFTQLNGFRENVVHPIFDQNIFLDVNHKMRLKEEYEIEPWSFVQRVGEAVIIPAGCPYQIRNLKSCVNVVLEFVSPESVAKSIQLIEEVRLLPDDHKAKAYKPEVKKMAIYSINEAIKGIRELTCSDS